MISVYADGSSTGRSNREWGWAFCIVKEGQCLLANYGGGPCGTNNIAELTAAIEGLKALLSNDWHQGHGIVELVSDSQYTLNIASGAFNAQKNLDLAKALKDLFIQTNARSRWIRGHSSNEWNNRCDSLAKEGKLKAKELQAIYIFG